jgi:dihydrofolate reductase
MTKLKFDISMSLDGYIAGPGVSRAAGLGEGGEALHEWATSLSSFEELHGRDGDDAETGTDDDVLAEAFEGLGAAIMGKRMFCAEDGPWGDEPFEGWWGDEPPFGGPVFVLTHYEREPLVKDETTFTFVTDGIESALEQARDAAGGKDVAISGGANVFQQYLAAGHVDEMQIHIVPILLGGGTPLFAETAEPPSLRVTRVVGSPAVTHVRYEVQG